MERSCKVDRECISADDSISMSVVSKVMYYL